MNRWVKTAMGTLALVMVTTGCGAQDAQPADSAAASSASSPRTMENCGASVEVASTPERVFTIKSSPLELMLALGLEEHIVGSAFLDGELPERLVPEGWSPNVVSKEVPGREPLLALEPDFVFAGWESNLSADGVGDRETLARSGVQSYVVPPACEFGESATDPVSFEDIFDFIREVGLIFGAEDEAESLVADQQALLDQIERPEQAPKVLWYSSGDDTPFVGGGAGTPQMIMEAAGVSNLLSDEPQTWFSMPWESFVASDPEYIILVDAPWNSAAQKRERLSSHPVASRMTAVREGKFIEVPFATTEAGIRNVEAAQMIADAVSEFETP